MKALPRILYFICFLGLALVGALAFNRIAQPSMANVLTRAVFLAVFCAAPGLIHRRLWPVTVVLLPIACYVLIRTVMPLPSTVHGVAAQYHYYAEQLHRGALLYRSTPFPLALFDSPELTLLLSFLAFWVTGAAAFVSLGLRRPLPGIVLILALLGFGLTVDGSVRDVPLALLFVVLVACLLVLSRGVRRSGWKLRSAFAGLVIGAVGGVLALLLLAAAPSAAAAPWWNWQYWGLGVDRSVYTFNWLQNYPKLLDPQHNVPVLRVRSAYPSYWRANALDNFTGSAWVTLQAFLTRIPGSQVAGQYVYDIPYADLTVAGHTVTEDFSLQSASTNYLFIGGDPRSIKVDRELSPRINDMRALRVSSALGPGGHYSLTAIIPELDPKALVGLGTHYPDSVAAYLTLPFPRIADLAGPDKEATWRSTVPDSAPGGSEWVGLYTLNQRIIGDATDPYQITLRIEEYLRQFYSYSLSPPPSKYSSPYAAFLFDTRTGYCQHFAGAMALLLRFNGIPSRVAVGFTSGKEESPGVYLVSSNNAHAWVEVYFPRVGWIAFDPTPGRSLPNAGGSSTSPGFINPFQDSNPSGTGTVNTTVPTVPKGNQGTPTGVVKTGGRSWLSRATWFPWVVGLIVLLAGWPLVRSLWRHRLLHRGSWDRRFQASLGLLRRDLREHGAPVTTAQTLEEILQSAGLSLCLKPDPAFVDRADAVLFGGRGAGPRDFEQAETLRHLMNARLRRRQGWVRTGLAWYGVSPSRR